MWICLDIERIWFCERRAWISRNHGFCASLDVDGLGTEYLDRRQVEYMLGFFEARCPCRSYDREKGECLLTGKSRMGRWDDFILDVRQREATSRRHMQTCEASARVPVAVSFSIPPQIQYPFHLNSALYFKLFKSTPICLVSHLYCHYSCILNRMFLTDYGMEHYLPHILPRGNATMTWRDLSDKARS